MSNILKTHSFSFLYDLKEFFSFNETDIKNFLSENIPDILKNDIEIRKQLKNYKELKTFLKKKRNRELKKEEFDENKRHFESSVSLKDVNNLTINPSSDGDIYILMKK